MKICSVHTPAALSLSRGKNNGGILSWPGFDGHLEWEHDRPDPLSPVNSADQVNPVHFVTESGLSALGRSPQDAASLANCFAAMIALPPVAVPRTGVFAMSLLPDRHALPISAGLSFHPRSSTTRICHYLSARRGLCAERPGILPGPAKGGTR